MNALTKKDGDFSTLQLLNAVQAVLNGNGETVAALVQEANRLTANKAEKAEIDTKSDDLWQSVFTLAKATADATAEYGNVKMTRAAFGIVMESVTGEAAATVKSYASTAGKMLEAIAENREGISFPVLEDKGYAEVRKAIAPDERKAVDAEVQKLNKLVARIRKHKSAAEAIKMLSALAELAGPDALAADASREKAKKAAVAATELESLRQQAPSEPATLETVRSAVA